VRLGRDGLFLFAAICATTPASASYTLIGAGLASCGTWTQDRKNRTIDQKQIEQWMLGFLSGVGYTGGTKYDPLHGVDAPAVLVWIDNYCLANPLKHLSEAAHGFIDAHPK